MDIAQVPGTKHSVSSSSYDSVKEKTRKMEKKEKKKKKSRLVVKILIPKYIYRKLALANQTSSAAQHTVIEQNL